MPYNTAPASYRNMYQDREIRLRPNVPADQREKSVDILRGYYAHIAALDDCLKRLLASLERSGKAENTIVVFTSDHGDMMLSQGLTTKLYPWDESLHVPFLIRYPRKLGNKGRRVSTPVNAPDIMPTLLGMCGLRVPDSVEGQDAFAPRTKAGAFINLPVPITEARRHGFAEYRGLRTEHHTYVRSIRGPWLLYDNDRDPYQMHNLCGKPEHKQVQSELDHSLDARLREFKDDFLPGTEYLRRAGLTHYKEANVPIGYHRSPWNDWESTLKP
jgi:arylsulfatase A-like enzyme